jgi:hypothetical protein
MVTLLAELDPPGPVQVSV